MTRNKNGHVRNFRHRMGGHDSRRQANLRLCDFTCLSCGKMHSSEAALRWHLRKTPRHFVNKEELKDEYHRALDDGDVDGLLVALYGLANLVIV